MRGNLYVSKALVSCFDGEGTNNLEGALAGAQAAAAAAAAGTTIPGAAPDANPPKLFTQDQLNNFVAAERKKQEAALQKMEQGYKDLLANNQSLTAKERQQLEENLATVQGQLRTKEQQAAVEKKELEESFKTKLDAAEKRATQAETRYRESTITRALQDAAVVNDAFRPSQIVTLLKESTKLIEENGEYKVMVELPDEDPTTGETVLTVRTPEDAVKRMKEKPEIYGNLFKSNVVSGIGSNSTVDGLPSEGGKINIAKIAKDPVLFRKVLKENPQALGLTSRPGSPIGR